MYPPPKKKETLNSHLEQYLCGPESPSRPHFSPADLVMASQRCLTKQPRLFVSARTGSRGGLARAWKLSVALASPVTCQSVSVGDGPLPPLTPPAGLAGVGGMTGDKAGVTGQPSLLSAAGRGLPLQVSL